MPVGQGRLQRSLGSMSFGVAREMADRRRRLEVTALAERELQFQVPITGEAADIPGYGEVELRFRIEFVNATGQRDSPYTVPTFTFGVVLESDDPVIISAAVVQYRIDEREAVRGATLAVGALNPGLGPTPFHGKLHAVFQGYGAPDELEVDEGDL